MPEPMIKPVLQVVVGSTRPRRSGLAVATWFHELAISHGGFSVQLVDLAEINLPLLDEPMPAQRGEYTHKHTRRWSQVVAGAHAFAFVIPEYNHSYNAATKNALDYLSREWRGKPVMFVGYGGVAAGARAIQALLPVVYSLGMQPIAQSVNVPFVRQHLGPNGVFHPSSGLKENAGHALDELRARTWAPTAVSATA